MSKRTFVRGRKAAPKFQFHNLRSSFQSEPGAGSRLTRTALLTSAGILALSANAQAASFNVTDQAGFDAAISTARSNNASDTINLTIPTSPSFTVIRTDGSYTLPGDGQSLNLNIAPANAPSGFNIATFAVAGGDTLTITDGTTINVAPSDVSLMRINVGDSSGAGTINMTGGQVTFTPHDSVDPSQYSYMVIGRDGKTGTFNQSGGDVELGATTVIGTDGATGTYTVSGNATLGIASTTEPNAGYFFIGYNQTVGETGTGVLHIEDSAHVTLDNYIRLHVGSAFQPTANLTGSGDGTIIQDGAGSVVDFSGQEFVFGDYGAGGTGTYELDAGTLNLNPNPIFSDPPAEFGAFAGATGKFIQNGGVFTTNADVQFGYNGTGTYDLSDGSATFSNGMTIAANGGSVGTVTQTGGDLSLTGGKITFGSGTGTYSLNGGTLDVGVADPFTNGGTFNLGGGTLKAGAAFSASRNFALTTSTTSTVDTNGNAVGLSGVLSGDGSLTKTGDGTLTLSGANTYTGATTIDASTVALSGAGTIADSKSVSLTSVGSTLNIVATTAGASVNDLSGVTGSVVDLGTRTLTEVANDDTTFSGKITGARGLTKEGAKTFTLGGDSDYTGNTAVNAGTLRFGTEDAIQDSAKLSVNNTSTLDLGGAGTQHINSDLTFASGARYDLTLSSGDTITAGGDAALDGSVFVRGGTGAFDPSGHYVIVTSNGVTGITGTFSSISDDLAFLDAQLDTPSATQATISFEKSSTTFASVGMTPNEVSVGGALDGLNVGNPLFDEIATLSVPDALAAIDSMEGDIHASTKSVLTEAATYVADATEDHIRNVLGGAGGAGADTSPMTSAARPGGPGLWINGYGHSLNLDDPSGNAADVSSTNGGLVAGLDFGSDGWIAGIGAGYDKASLSADSHMSSANVDGYTALAYAAAKAGLVNLSVGGSYTGNAISSTRTVVLPMTQTLTASYNGSTTQAFGEVGIGMGGFEPFVGANYIGVATDGFAESGGSAEITAAASDQSVTFTTLGVRARLAAANGLWVNGMAGWRHAFGDITPVMNGTIQAQAFAVDGAPIATDALVAEAGIDAALGPNGTIGVSYLGQIGANAQDHGAKATATLNF